MRIQITTSKVARTIRCFAVYLLLLLTSGFYIYAQGFHLPCMLIVAAIYFLTSKKEIDIKMLCAFVLMIVIVVISGLVNDEIVRNIIVPCVDMFGGALIAFGALGSKQKGEFLHIYRQVMLVIAIGSMILFAIGAIANAVFSIFPVFADSKGEVYFAGLAFIYKKRQYLQYRNMGIFWEPGAFQTYLIVAMILQDMTAEKHKMRNLLIFSVAMLTTVSTTGIFCMLLFWLLYACKNENKKVGILTVILLLMGIFVAFTYPEILPEQMKFGIIEKINDILSGDAELRTVRTRLDSIVYPAQAFWQHPLFGVSRSGMRAWSQIAGHGMNTCTPINWFAHYGIFMGAILLTGFSKFFLKISSKRWVGICLLLIFLISISTEAFNYNPTLLCFAFMGISGKRNILPEETNHENTPE